MTTRVRTLLFGCPSCPAGRNEKNARSGKRDKSWNGEKEEDAGRNGSRCRSYSSVGDKKSDELVRSGCSRDWFGYSLWTAQIYLHETFDWMLKDS